MDPATAALIGGAVGALITQAVTLVGQVLHRRHERRERRYEDRRVAYRAFTDTCRRIERETWEYEEQHGELHAASGVEGYPELEEPFAELAFIAPMRVRDAAEKYVSEINWWAFGNGSYEAVRKARTKYMTVMQTDLKLQSRWDGWRERRRERKTARAIRKAEAEQAAALRRLKPPPGIEKAAE